ncbi:MAG: AraC family transcriptional regulator [Saccharofermentanales bacterium]
MLLKHTFSQKDTTDLRMVNCGIEDCLPAHKWGPGIRNRFVLHIVLSGKGTFISSGIHYKVEAGQGFLISPGKLVEYSADNFTPWTYVWVGFEGISAQALISRSGIFPDSPVFSVAEPDVLRGSIEKMLALASMERGRDEMLLGYLYQFFATLIMMNTSHAEGTKQSVQENYVRKCLEYIDSNYAADISVKALASHIGIDRSYLYSLFMKYLGKSPKDYITCFRMDRALDLFHTGLSIQEIARSVGYYDALLFSKNFKRYKGLSPSSYRSQRFSVADRPLRE